MSETKQEIPNWTELHAMISELSKSQKGTDQEMKETSRFIHELGKQIGALGNKFGSFTEGMALPAMNKILRQTFVMVVVSPRLQAWKNGECLEQDEAFEVEIPKDFQPVDFSV